MHFPNRSRLTSGHKALWMRLMARSILAGWLLPMMFALFAVWQGAPAQAQDEVRQTVVVLDFATAPGLDPLLGRKAADALAVELQRSNQYTVISRQRVDEAVGQQAGLQPPFNETAQVRLAQVVGADSVFSGTVSKVDVTPGTLARVDLQVRQLDASTSDYINGTFARESTEQRLASVANEILVDEAINKAAFSAVRSMRQTNLPTGTVLNTTRDDVELSIGSRNGVVSGQRYTILRDINNKARNVTERLKIGELTIKTVQNDQAIAVLSAGGAAGVRTGDRVRQIFVSSLNYTIPPEGASSVSPVTSAPVRDVTSKSKNKMGKGLLGILGLLAAVSLTGLGGGSGGSSTPTVADIRYSNITQSQPTPAFTINQTISGINLFKGLQNEAAVGYLVYRGTSRDFTPDAANLQAFVDGRNFGSSSRISFTDLELGVRTRNFAITSNTVTTGTATLNIEENDPEDRAPFFNQTEDGITFQFVQRPLQIGTTYYYRVVRISGRRQSTTTANATTITLLPVRGRVSQTTGAFTPLLLPVIIRDQNQYDTDNFSVRINSQTEIDRLTDDGSFIFPNNVNSGTGVDEFRIEVSTSSSFTAATTFISPSITPPAANGAGDVVFNLGNIRIPDTNANPYEPGLTTLYVRVSSRSDQSADRRFRISRTLVLEGSQVTGVDSANSHFVKPKAGGISIGSNRGGVGVSAAGGGGGVRVLRPR